MPSTNISFINRNTPLTYRLFNSVNSITIKKLFNLQILRRYASAQKWEFHDKDKGISGVFHHTITADTQDTDPIKIAQIIHNSIVTHKNSLFFLTQKSRVLRRSDDNPNFYLPMQKEELFNIELMIDLIKKQWLRPHGGHTCMAITNHHGIILPDTQVSLRPDKYILSGKTTLHPKLYSSLSGTINSSKHTKIEEEIFGIASKMISDKSITADLTFIPVSQTSMKLKDILENIRSTRAIQLYNLCSLVVKQKEINEINDETIRSCVEELKRRASEFPELKQIITSEADTVLAALACTHAIAKVCYGNTYAIDHKIGPDQDTQTAAVYCAMALLGTEKFINFARKINFLDVVSSLTKK